MRIKLVFLIFAFFLIQQINAVQIGLVIDFPDGTLITRCVNAPGGSNAYNILQSSGLSIAWNYHDLWGHGLCGINSVGCPSDNCWCSSDYWGFYSKKAGKRSWSYSAVGFDGGSTCSEHYCAKEGEMLGFAYGAYGTKPRKLAFEDVCKPPERKRRIFSFSIEPKEHFPGEIVKINITDNETGKGIRNAGIELFEGQPGKSKKLFSDTTDRNGYFEFLSPKTPGTYTIRVNVHKYSPPQMYRDLNIVRKRTDNTTENNSERNITNSFKNNTISSTVILKTTTTQTTTTKQDLTANITITTQTSVITTSKPSTTTTIITTTSTTTTKATTTTTFQVLSTTTIEDEPQNIITGKQIQFSTEGNLILDALLLLLFGWFIALKKHKNK